MKYILILLSYFVSIHSAMAAGINCTKVKANSSAVEKAICKESKLTAIDHELGSLFENLGKQVTGEQRDLLLQTQKFFIIERNHCQNQDTSKGEFRSLVKKCIEEKYQSRIAALKDLKDSSDSFSILTRDLTFFDVPFVKAHGMKLVGKTIRVAGSLSLEGKKPGSPAPVKGIIKDEKDTVPVVFKSMPDSQAEFLERNKPFGHHEVIVDQENGKVILRVSSILGQKLP